MGNERQAQTKKKKLKTRWKKKAKTDVAIPHKKPKEPNPLLLKHFVSQNI